MKRWVTEFKAEDSRTGDLKTYGGPYIEAPTAELAQEWCYENAGHLRVIGELIMEIPCNDSGPDWDNAVDYENAQLN